MTVLEQPVLEQPVLEKSVALPWQGLLALYRDLAGEAPESLGWAALALREKARAGDLPAELIPALALLLQDSDDPSVATNLGKTLAAFGRDAELATQIVVDRVRAMHVTSDETFWALDSLLHVLGYIGERELTLVLVEELTEAKPCPVTRAGSLYQGTMPADEREETFGFTLRRVPKMLALEDLGGWTQKRTKLTRAAVVETGGFDLLSVRTQR